MPTLIVPMILSLTMRRQGRERRMATPRVLSITRQIKEGNNQRCKGRPPPRSCGSSPTLEQLLNEHCPRHDTPQKPATHLWKDCTIMKAFKNSNMFTSNHGPGGGSGGGGFHGPSGGSNSNFQGSQGSQGGYNQQSGQGGQQQQ